MEFVTYVRETIPLWLVLTFFSVIAAYWYITKTYSYWKRHNIPFVKPLPLLGTVGAIIKRPFHEVEIERYKEKGPIYGTYDGNKPVLTIGKPEILRDILVKDFKVFSARKALQILKTGTPVLDRMVTNLEGEDWRRVRSIITPAFTTGRVKKMTNIFIECAKTLTENFKKATKEGKPLDIKKCFSSFMMDVITNSVFGIKTDSHNDPENPFVTNARAVFKSGISWSLALFFVLPALTKLLRLPIMDMKPIKFFKETALKVLEERKKTGQKRNDFLQLMIDSSVKEDLENKVSDENYEAKDIGHEENNDQVFKSVHSTKSLSSDELIAQCVIFFLGGYDTTSLTLSFAAYELALNPEVQDRLIAEIDKEIMEKGELQYEAISEMKYLDCVISETLRKYPPVSRIQRIASEDYHVKSLDFTIPKDMIVGVPIYAMHHDPQYYPDPEKFDPDRFTPEQKATRHSYAYMPFSAGPRNCIAVQFALRIIKVCLVCVLSQCRFSTCAETQVPIEYFVGSGLMKPKNITLKVDIRNNVEKL